MRHIKERLSYAFKEARDDDIMAECAIAGLAIADGHMEEFAKARAQGISSLCDVARITFPIVGAGFAIACTPVYAAVGVILKPIGFAHDFINAPVKKKPDMQP